MKTISEYAEVRDTLLAQLTKLEIWNNDLKDELSLSIIEKKQFKVIAENLRNENFVIAVVGVIKRGKSTLLNALLGTEQELLSTRVTPETARLCFLKYASEPYAIIHKLKGDSEKIEIVDLPKFTSASGNNLLSKKTGVKELVDNTKFAELHYPNRYLKDGVIIVDTPGVDDPDRSRSEVTENFISSADAVLFLIDAVGGGLKESELRFLKSRIINSRSSKGIIVVVNKINALRRHQRPELEQLLIKTKQKLESELDVSVPVFPVDALDAFKSKRDPDSELWKKSQFAEFLDGLESMLLDDKGKFILKKRITEILSQIVGPTMGALQYELTTSPDNLKQLEIDLNQTKMDLEKIKNTYSSSQSKFGSQLTNLKSFINAEIHTSLSNPSISVENIQTYFAREITRLNKQITKKLQSLMQEYMEKIQAQKISIPNIMFQVKNPNLDMNMFYTVESSTEVNVSDDTAIRTAGAAAIGTFILPGLGTLIGGAIGFFSGMKSTEKQTRTLDTRKFESEINKAIKMIIRSYEKQCDSYADHFNQRVSQWFDDQRKLREVKRKSIEAAKNLKQNEYEDRCKSVSQYINQLAAVESSLSTIKNKL